MDDPYHAAIQPDALSISTKKRRRTTTNTKEAQHRTSRKELQAALQAAEQRAEQAERHLRQLEARLAALVSIPDQWIWTSNSNGPVGANITGGQMSDAYPQGDPQEHHWLDAIHPDDRERARTAWTEAVTTRSAYENVQRMCRADGAYHTLLVRAVPNLATEDSAPEWIGTTTDITNYVARLERERAAHAETEAVKAQLQAVLNVLPLGLVIADANGQIRIINPAVYHIWGNDAPALHDIAGYREYKGYWPDTGQRLESEEWALARSLLHGEEVIGEEVDIETFDGECKTILNSTAPIRDASGTIVGGVAAMLDITARKQLEHEALAGAAQLGATFEALGDAIAIVDNQGNVLRMNAAARGMMVFDVDPIAYTALSAAEQEQQQALCDAEGHPLPLEQWPRFRIARGEVLQGDTAMGLITRSRDGHTLYVTATGAPIRDTDGHILGGVTVYRDETQRKQLEHALRASMAEARHRADEVATILDAITDGVLLYNAEGQLVRTNAAARRLLTGKDELPEEWGQHNAAERTSVFVARDLDGNVLSPEQYPFSRIMRGEVLTGANIAEVETHRLDGSPITISVSGAPLYDEQGALRGSVCVSRDVTQRIQLEKTLREREAMFRNTFEQAAVGMAHTGMDGHWLRVNERMCAITGYSREELLARRFQDITHPDDVEANLARARDLLAGKSQTYTMEKRYIRKNGTQIWVNLTVALARTPPGAERYFITVVEDISARKLLEQQRSDLLSIVAHDLSNPLTAMKTQLQLIHHQLTTGKQPEASLTQTAASALRRMERLVGDLRDVTSADTRRMALKIAPCDVVALCRAEVEVQMQTYKERQIDINAPAEPIIAEIDADRIARLLGNLLSNAIKYSSPGQPIILSLERGVAPSPDGSERAVARITVRDYGIGIAPDVLPHIFERFYRAPGVHEEQQMQPSLGLGLYICHMLLEEHGGTIRAESIPGQGSTFFVTLPLTHQRRS